MDSPPQSARAGMGRYRGRDVEIPDGTDVVGGAWPSLKAPVSRLAAPLASSGPSSQKNRSWNHLWLHEVEIDEVPRAWLRWAVEFLQGLRKVTSGTPVDNQISTYLIDADVFLTSDRAFVDIVTKVREASIVAVAGALWIAVNDPLNSLGAALEDYDRR